MKKSKTLELYRDSQILISFRPGPPPEEYISLNQTHSCNVLTLDETSCHLDGQDGIIFPKTTDQTIVIKTADCLPIVYIGTSHIALVHAGWKGLSNKIHLNEMVRKIEPTHIYTGPSICDQCFEVTSEFKEHFPNDIDLFKTVKNSMRFLIKSKVLRDLKKQFPKSTIKISSECTLCSDHWHSHRRDKTKERNFTIFNKVTS